GYRAAWAILLPLTKVGEAGRKLLARQYLPRGHAAGPSPSQTGCRSRYCGRPTGLWEISMNRLRPLFALLALVAVFAMLAGDADARPRGSFGSRGTRTFSAPPPTATAPTTAAPINRTMTQPGATSTAARPPVSQPRGLFGGFGRGLAGGLLGGLLGAGLIGMLMGN